MYKIALAIIAFLCSTLTYGQHSFQVKVMDPITKQPLASATVEIKGIKKTMVTDSAGIALFNEIPAGQYKLAVSHIGHIEQLLSIKIPYTEPILVIQLEEEGEEEEEVIVQSTRTSRAIVNVPTRVETITMEEVDEKTNMRPANVAMILHESTGIQVQQTSATSANASIRIQGLDGRYTQLLKDGFPNYGNFASGLSILEIPPLDLKQVEIIKGPVSPLYGGGAIAGVINFISRTPKMAPEYNFIINQSNIGQTNIGGFAAQRGKKAGFTLLALYNRQELYDVDKDGFTELPESNEFSIHPKLFLYPNDKTIITIGNSFTTGKRTGGDVQVIKETSDAQHQYFEENETIRNTSTIELDIKKGEHNRIVARQSVGFFDRSITMPSYYFSGREYNSFTDISYLSNKEKHALVLGGNFIYNNFKEKASAIPARNNTVSTGGVYGQHTWDASEKMKLESGLRADITNYHNSIYEKTELFVLPRISMLLKFNSNWTSRIGGGMGYKTPTLFTEESEMIQYKNVAQLDSVTSEKSYGATADVNFKINLSAELQFTMNHMFFYSSISDPIVLEDNGSARQFVNAGGNLRSSGFETNARLVFKEHFKAFLGYTFTDTKAGYLAGNQFLPLVPKHKINTALIYEKENLIKIGLEGYFTGKQYLSNGEQTPAFSEFGFMVEKIFKKFSVYINFENFTDTRQSKYKPVVSGPVTDPVFDEIWTHTEGFVFNGGIKIRL